jgi:hypothetical protein
VACIINTNVVQTWAGERHETRSDQAYCAGLFEKIQGEVKRMLW